MGGHLPGSEPVGLLSCPVSDHAGRPPFSRRWRRIHAVGRISWYWQAFVTVAAVWPYGSVMAQERETPVSFNGSVGFRIEYIANEQFATTLSGADDDHRLRSRVRARASVRFQRSPSVMAEMRLATGAADFPSSAWSSLNDPFTRDAMQLDRAFVRITPSPRIEVRLGLDDNVAFRVSEVVWDDDVAPAGLTQLMHLGIVDLLAGQYMAREVRSSTPAGRESAFLLINGLSLGRGTRRQWRVGAYHYYYSRPDAIAVALTAGELNAEFRTNRFAGGGYFSGYSVLTGSARVVQGRWRAGAEAAVNLGARRDPSLGPGYQSRENVAVGALVRYGDTSRPWGWSVEAGFFHIEADAVLAAFNSDDLQQTNVNTVPFWVRLMLPEGAGVVWDTYVQRKVNVNLASSGGVVHPENATKVRTRLSLEVDF